MPQELLDNETFLSRLESAYKAASEEGSRAGSVWLTHKRYTYDDSTTSNTKDEADVEMEAVNEGKEYDVLVRCTNGADVNFSTRIPPTALLSFQTTYSSLLRASFAPTMIKRDKKKEKLKAEKREQWKKDLMVDVRTESRGTGGGKVGHRQRARRLQAQRKKEAQREELEERERTSTRLGV